MSKICHITTVHYALDTRIFHKECSSLNQSGFEVYLIAPGQQDNKTMGINIVSIPSTKSRMKRIFVSQGYALIRALQIKANIYHFHDPELIITGLLLKLLGKKVIYDVHEDYRKHIKSKFWIPRLFRSMIAIIFGMVESLASKTFDGLVVATPYIRTIFDQEHIAIVQNFPIITEFIKNETQVKLIPRENFVYVGSLSEIRGLKEMVEAIMALPTEFEGKLMLAGTFQPNDLKEKIRLEERKNRLEYTGFLGRPEVADLLDKALAGLVLLHPVPNYLDGYPVKMFEYMAAEIPVIASDFPLWRSIIEENNCGICVDPLDVNRISEAMIWMVDNPDKAREMGENGRKAVIEKYNWERESKKLIALYEKLLK